MNLVEELLCLLICATDVKSVNLNWRNKLLHDQLNLHEDAVIEFRRLIRNENFLRHLKILIFV